MEPGLGPAEAPGAGGEDMNGSVARGFATPLFDGLDSAEVADLVQEGSTQYLAPGTRLFAESDPAARLYLVVEGQVKLASMAPNGKQVVLGIMGPGDLVGCEAVFRRTAYRATATGVSESMVLSWSAVRVFQLFEYSPRLATNALAIVSGRAEDFMQRMREVAIEPVEQRLARTLLKLAPPDRREAPRTGSPVEIALSRRDLGDMTGMSLFTVSRIVQAWQQQGIVRGGRQRLLVLDPTRLSHVAVGKALRKSYSPRRGPT